MAGKADLAVCVAENLEISKAQAEMVVTAVVAAIQDITADGSRLTLQGFGAFIKKTSKARTGTNPQTGGKIDIPAKTKLTFKVAK